jgi:4-amino-4-deoxy-L-arabinose transferase-like glycosyltransferase
LRWKNPLTLQAGKLARLGAAVALCGGIFLALLISHWTLLRLPYYWDEAGYYIPAAWDFFRTGSLIPLSTLTNAHPPLPSIYLAGWWHLFGFSPLVTRVATLFAATLALLAVGRLSFRLTASRAVTLWTVLLTALYPVWFAQSALAHADIFAAACTLWGLVYSLPRSQRSPLRAACWFSLAALAKETAIAVPLTLALAAAAELFHAKFSRESGDAAPDESAEAVRCNSTPAFLRKSRLELSAAANRTLVTRLSLTAEACWMAACVLPLGCWYLYHRHKTGFFFGNPEFLRYNAQANLEPMRFLAAFGHRLLHLTAHMNLFVLVLAALAALFLPLRKDYDGAAPRFIARMALWRIFLLILANAVFFSILGGALLTRYLLPIYPLVILLALSTLRRHLRRWWMVALLAAAAFVAGLFIDPPYGFAPEDNLSWARFVRLHQAGITELQQRYPDATVLSSWPLTDALRRPELGYLQAPYEVFPVDDFSAQEIRRAADHPESFSTALVFSTKLNPQSTLFTLGERSKELDVRYFGLHQDLAPEAIARILDGDLVWEQREHGQWIALIRFHRAVYAWNRE